MPENFLSLLSTQWSPKHSWLVYSLEGRLWETVNVSRGKPRNGNPLGAIFPSVQTSHCLHVGRASWATPSSSRPRCSRVTEPLWVPKWGLCSAVNATIPPRLRTDPAPTIPTLILPLFSSSAFCPENHGHLEGLKKSHQATR